MHYRLSDFELDTDRELLTGPDGPVALRRQTYRLLLLLVERAPALVTRDELMDELWGHHALSPNVIPQTVSELRQALGDDPQQPRFVETRHRRGYAFIAPVIKLANRESVEPAGDTAPVAPPIELEAPSASIPSSRLLRPGYYRFAWLVLSFLLLALTGWFVFLQTPPPDQSVPQKSLAEQRLVITLDVADPALSAYLTLLARASSDWVASRGLQTKSDRYWRLSIDAGGRWSLLDTTGAQRSSGDLPRADVPNQAAALLHSIEAATGHDGLLQAPLGWPEDLEGRMALLEAALACTEQRYAEALAAYARVKASGWPQFFHAEALARIGDWKAARGLLADFDSGADRALNLQVEALRADLAGRPAESLAALRAYALLLPEAVDVRLAVLDAQLAQAQWAAAADSLESLGTVLGEQSPQLAWRRAQWLAVMQAAKAGDAYLWAVQSATEQSDAQSMQQAQRTYVSWLIGRSQLNEAAAVLDHMDGNDPKTAELRGQWASERGDLERARAEYTTAIERWQTRGLNGDARRASLGLIELALRAGDAPLAVELAESLLVESAQQGDSRLEGDGREALGRAYTGLGKFALAIEHLSAATELARSRGDVRREATGRYHLGNALAQERKRPQEAEQAYRIAADAFRSLRDDLWEVKSLANLALMAERDGRRLQAREAYRDALARVRELGIPRELGRISFNVGVNERELGQLADAAAHFAEAAQALQQAGATDVRIVVAAARADLAYLQGDASGARKVLDEVNELRESSAPLPKSSWLTAAARGFELAGDNERADALLSEAENVRLQAGVRTALLDVQLRRLRLNMISTDAARSAQLSIERIEDELQRLGEAKFAMTARLAAVEAKLMSGDLNAAKMLIEGLRANIQSRGNRTQQLQLDWLNALSSKDELRKQRLLSLTADAKAAGFELLSRLAMRELSASASTERMAMDRAFVMDGLQGATRSAAAAF